jgi:hypothetical protein
MSQSSDDRTTEENLSTYEDTVESTTIKTETDQLSVHDAEEEPQDNFQWIKTPLINQRFILKHPRVLLSFLRFIDEFNELADPDEVLLLPAIPQRIVEGVFNHTSMIHPPLEFVDAVQELRHRLEAHMDLSELPQDHPQPQ